MNLLPPEAQARRRVHRRRLQALAALGGIGAALAVAAGLSWSQSQGRESTLAVALAEQTRLQRAAADLAGVSRLATEVRAGQGQLSQAFAEEVRWSRYLAGLSDTTPEQAWLLHLTAAQDGAPGNVSQTADGVARGGDAGAGAPVDTDGSGTGGTGTGGTGTGGTGTGGIGQARFTGRAESHDEVAAFLAALARQRGHRDAYLVDSTATQDEAGRDVIAFNAYVTLTRELLSGRYPARVTE